MAWKTSSTDTSGINFDISYQFDNADDGADSMNVIGQFDNKRRRTTKACDKCRETKSKCGPGSEIPCGSCAAQGFECKFSQPTRKRGPPKGFLSGLENRLSQAEALIGVLLHLRHEPDSRGDQLVDLFRDLEQDPYAQAIIQRVEDSANGPRSRQSDRGSLPSTDRMQPDVDLQTFVPSRTWQDTLISAVSTATDNHRHQRRKLSAGPSTSSTDRKLSASSDQGSIHSSDADADGEEEEESEDEDLAIAMGELSIDHQDNVRYHSRVSGLHMLGITQQGDEGREGMVYGQGIWRFPPMKRSSLPVTPEEDVDEYAHMLPSNEEQDQLLELYFAHVHPILPVVMKSKFLEMYHGSRAGRMSSSLQSINFSPGGTPHLNRRRNRASSVVLLAMFSIAERLVPPTSLLRPTDGSKWTAGDLYMYHVKQMILKEWPISRIEPCQALLLLVYRQIGMNLVSSAWAFLGMAIRMAQDMGLHRRANRWARAGLGGSLFQDWELQERNQIWWCCVHLDTYLSNFMGRPLMINALDSDVEFVNERELLLDSASCFNTSALLSNLTASINRKMYAPGSVSHRAKEYAEMESVMDKWYHDLPANLCYESSPLPGQPVPASAILTLHMQYWCAVLLLHRPFIRFTKTAENEEARMILDRTYEMGASAANHIASIAGVYLETYSLKQCPAFLCYYLFTASVMHITTLWTLPDDPQAKSGLKKCLGALKDMESTWPNAMRSISLLSGSKIKVDYPELHRHSLPANESRRKRPAYDPTLTVSGPTPELLHRRRSVPHMNAAYQSSVPSPHSVTPISGRHDYQRRASTSDQWTNGYDFQDASSRISHQPHIPYSDPYGGVNQFLRGPAQRSTMTPEASISNYVRAGHSSPPQWNGSQYYDLPPLQPPTSHSQPSMHYPQTDPMFAEELYNYGHQRQSS